MSQPSKPDEITVDRIPLARSVRYIARGLPDVPFQYGPGVIRPSEITLTYRDTPDSQLGRVHAYVTGRLWVGEREVPMGSGYGQHYDDGLSNWPDWLTDEAQLHDPDAVSVPAPTDEPALRDRIAEALMRWAETGNSPKYASMRRPETVRQNANGRAAAALAELKPELDALGRVRDVCDQLRRAAVLADGRPRSDRERGVVQAVTRIMAALDGQALAVAASGSGRVADETAHIQHSGASLRDCPACRPAPEPPRPPYEPQWFGIPGCTCKPWTNENGHRRFMEPSETVDRISGWHVHPRCPHHAQGAASTPAAPAEEAQSGAQPCDGCGHPAHPARECPVTQYGERCPCDEPLDAETHQPETVHGCPPDGSGLTPCCGRTPLELPLTDRISSEAPTTCTGASAPGGTQPRPSGRVECGMSVQPWWCQLSPGHGGPCIPRRDTPKTDT
ncbi:hypothetical protein ACWCPD_16130 [Streptomyces sp. NPDC001935]